MQKTLKILSRLRKIPPFLAFVRKRGVMNAKKKPFGGMSLSRHARATMSGGITPPIVLRSKTGGVIKVPWACLRGIPYFCFFLLGSAGLSACNKDMGIVPSADEGKFSVALGKGYNYADVLIKRVIDGDTLQLENGERVRLIGIDTPELHQSKKLYRDAERTRQDARTIQKLGQRAYEFTRNLVEGRRVRLEFDLEKHDIYKRLLAYVYLKDGTFVNAEIVKQGYANLMTFPPNVRYAEDFLKLYRDARDNKRGLWGK